MPGQKSFFKRELLRQIQSQQGIPPDHVHPAIDQSFCAALLLPKGPDPAVIAQFDASVAFEIPHRLQRHRAVGPQFPVKRKKCCDIHIVQRIPVANQHVLRLTEGDGSADRTAGPQRCFLADDGYLRIGVFFPHPCFNDFREVTCRQDDPAGTLTAQPADQDLQKGPAVDGGHAFGQVGDDRTKAGTQAAGEDDGIEFHGLLQKIAASVSSQMI